MPLNTCVHVVVLRLYQHSCRKGPTPRDANGKNEWHPGSLTNRWRSVFLMSKGENDQLFVYFKFLRIAILIVRLRITHLSIVWSNTLTLIGINNPGDSSGVQSCPGRHPNHSAGSCFFLFFFFPRSPMESILELSRPSGLEPLCLWSVLKPLCTLPPSAECRVE